jgi:hypothetical protein
MVTTSPLDAGSPDACFPAGAAGERVRIAPPCYLLHLKSGASELGDTGESRPDNWEEPLGTPDVHIVMVALAPNQPCLETLADLTGFDYRTPNQGNEK